MALNIKDDNFEAIVAEGKPVVLDFWATWCGPCKQIAPYIEELAEEYKDKVNIGKCDVDENADLPAQFGVRNIPTVLFIKNGEVVDKQVGATTKSALQAKVSFVEITKKTDKLWEWKTISCWKMRTMKKPSSS